MSLGFAIEVFGYPVVHEPWPEFGGFAVGTAVAGLCGYAVGRLSFKVRGAYFVIVTISFRLGLELAKEDPARKAELEKDIAELDLLVDEILLASRLDAVEHLNHAEEIDLLALAAEECARATTTAASKESRPSCGGIRRCCVA